MCTFEGFQREHLWLGILQGPAWKYWRMEEKSLSEPPSSWLMRTQLLFSPFVWLADSYAETGDAGEPRLYSDPQWQLNSQALECMGLRVSHHPVQALAAVQTSTCTKTGLQVGLKINPLWLSSTQFLASVRTKWPTDRKGATTKNYEDWVKVKEGEARPQNMSAPLISRTIS